MLKAAICPIRWAHLFWKGRGSCVACTKPSSPIIFFLGERSEQETGKPGGFCGGTCGSNVPPFFVQAQKKCDLWSIKSINHTFSTPFVFVSPERLELSTHWLRVSCSTNWARETFVGTNSANETRYASLALHLFLLLKSKTSFWFYCEVLSSACVKDFAAQMESAIIVLWLSICVCSPCFFKSECKGTAFFWNDQIFV